MHGERGPILVAPVEQYKAMNENCVESEILKAIVKENARRSDLAP